MYSSSASYCIHPDVENSLIKWLKVRSHPAFLLIGNPGVGKTTLVHSVCKQEKYLLKEFNASHVRTGSYFREIIYPLLTEKGITEWICPSMNCGKAVLLDEIDGLSQGEKGGINELYDFLKENKKTRTNPLILISNILEGKTMKQLKKYCFIQYIHMPEKSILEGVLRNTISDELYSLNDVRKIFQHTVHTTFTQQITNPVSSMDEDDTHIAVKAAWYTLFDKWKRDEELSLETKDANLSGIIFHQNIPLYLKENNAPLDMYILVLELLRISDVADFWAFFHQAWTLLPFSYNIKLKYPNIYIQQFEKPNPIPSKEELVYTQILTKQSSLFNAWKEMKRISDEEHIPFSCICQWASEQQGKLKDTLGIPLTSPHLKT